MTVSTCHRLDGLEPDNLLAFMTLLGLLRALEVGDTAKAEANKLRPRAAWDIATLPLRPKLFLQYAATPEEVTESAAAGIEMIVPIHDFGNQQDLNYSRNACRIVLQKEASAARLDTRERIDLLAALMSDAAIKDDKKEPVYPTPLCLLFGQGHQHFLGRLSSVPRELAPSPRGKGKEQVALSAAECLAEALFRPWHRDDRTFSFRWDPDEDVRYALMAGDPTDPAYKARTQHGANRLAAIGLAVLTLAPEIRAGRARPAIIGGVSSADGFSFAWPIWHDQASLNAIRGLLSHPDLRKPGELERFGVDHVVVAQRVSVGKFMNFARARPITQFEQASADT